MCHLISFTAASLCLIVVHLSTGLNIVCQMVSWVCLSRSNTKNVFSAHTKLQKFEFLTVSAFILPLLQTTNRRLEAIIDGLSIPYLLMSLSYEPIFLLVLSLNLEYFVEMHRRKVNQSSSFVSLDIFLAPYHSSNAKYFSDKHHKTSGTEYVHECLRFRILFEMNVIPIFHF